MQWHKRGKKWCVGKGWISVAEKYDVANFGEWNSPHKICAQP